MFLFDKIKEPVFLKESSSAVQQLEALKILQQKASDELQKKIEEEIKIVEAGIYGENQIMFELKNSHIPMVVMHDLFFEVEGYTAQIDYLIVTRYKVFIIECKNLIGNIEIDSSGAFTRTLNYGKMYRKEGIYSPITQNQRHLEVIKKIREKAKNSWLAKRKFERAFGEAYRSVVVLANPKTYLNAKYAKKEVKNQVIRGDQLIDYIKKVNVEKNASALSEKNMMELAQYFYQESTENPIDYLEKYREEFLEEKEQHAEEEKKSTEEEKIKSDSAEESLICPRCGAPMVKRVATKGSNAGKQFWGCSMFPKCREIINIEQ